MSSQDDDYEKDLRKKLLSGTIGSESKRAVAEVENSLSRKEKLHDLKHQAEDQMIDLIDLKRELRYLAPIYEKLSKGQIDVQGAINKSSKIAWAKVMQLLLFSNSEKVQADVAKHMLALAGHSPTQKIELGRIDPETPKQALIAEITGATKELKDEGIEVVDDRDTDQTES
jgi:hypothetical protein